MELKLANRISKASNILIICGAGISCSSGIPDFRSPKSGIYNIIAELREFNSLPQPECLFTIDFFNDDPKPFWNFATRLYPTKFTFQPSVTHHFFHLLYLQKKLLRVYTQNIDGLELEAGLPENKVVFCHGSMRKLKCQDCQRNFNAPNDISPFLKEHEVPVCGEVGIHCGDSSSDKDDQPQKKKRRRSARRSVKESTAKSENNVTRGCPGILKPCITFFGESISLNVMKKMKKDSKIADLVLVVGTSLQVRPLSTSLDLFAARSSTLNLSTSSSSSSLSSSSSSSSTISNNNCNEIGKTVNPTVILINKEKVDILKTGASRHFDETLLGECDTIFEKVQMYLG